jgi:hypothetical protein
MPCYRLSFACCCLRLFPASVAISSSRALRSTQLLRFLSRSDKGAHAFVLLSAIHQKNGETLTSYRCAYAGAPTVVGMLAARRPYCERVQALCEQTHRRRSV